MPLLFFCQLTMDLRFKHLFCCLISGPSSCGKSSLVSNLIENKHLMFDTKFNSITWCYGIWQSMYKNMEKKYEIVFHKGLPDIKTNLKEYKPRLIIIDDLMAESDQSVTNLFTKGSHHMNLSVIFITQNLFYKGKGSRD